MNLYLNAICMETVCKFSNFYGVIVTDVLWF